MAPPVKTDTNPMEGSALNGKLGLWLRIAQRAFAEAVNSDLRRFRLTQLDFFILILVQENPGGRQARIARALDIKSPNLAAGVDYLVALGLVTKVPDLKDRRANHLTLTPKGADVLQLIDAQYARVTASFFAVAETPEEIAWVTALLRRIALRAMADASTREDGGPSPPWDIPAPPMGHLQGHAS